MKNIKENQLKKCIFMGLDEFTNLVEELTDGLQTVEYEDGIYLTSTDKADETDTYWNEDMLETFSEYFGVEVTSFHSDNCEYVGVWICYKCKEEFIMNRTEMQNKIRLYVTDSIQKLEVFTDIEICSSKDNENAHEIMNNRLNAMTDIDLENMCDRIDFEDDYDSYYEIIG